jgi:ABC-2 type transport system ATP-binding protein
MFELKNVTKKFNSDLFTKEFVAVNNLSFELKMGSVTGFLGANGAGKTTSLKMIMDFIRPDSGEILFNEAMGIEKSKILSNLGFLPERPYFYPHLTGREFCIYMGKLSGLSKSDIDSQIQKWGPIFKIEFALDREVRNYSKGMLQRIGFLVTLLHDPKLIILDEPLSGLDPIGRKELKEVITKVNHEGKTVFFSSHIISDVEEVCQNVIFIKDGALFYEGTVEKIIGENSSGMTTITFSENDELSKLTIDSDKVNDQLMKLVQEKKEIIKVSRDRPSLEEIIYNVK